MSLKPPAHRVSTAAGELRRQLRISLLTPFLSLGLCECAQPQLASVPDVHSSDGAVYRAVLDNMAVAQEGGRLTQLVVIDSTLTVQSQDVELDRVSGADDASIGDFRRRNSQSGSLGYLSSPDLPIPIVLVTRRTLQSFQHNGPEQYWAEFYRRYPGSNGSIAFSSIGYSADGSVALLVVEQGCGSLCGALSNVVVKREREGWRVTLVQIKVIS